jgi:hypothetical protein
MMYMYVDFHERVRKNCDRIAELSAPFFDQQEFGGTRCHFLLAADDLFKLVGSSLVVWCDLSFFLLISYYCITPRIHTEHIKTVASTMNNYQDFYTRY